MLWIAVVGRRAALRAETRCAGRDGDDTADTTLALLGGSGAGKSTVVIGTPGLRAVALRGSDEGLARAFSDIEELAAACRFADCAHGGEGCSPRLPAAPRRRGGRRCTGCSASAAAAPGPLITGFSARHAGVSADNPVITKAGGVGHASRHTAG